MTYQCLLSLEGRSTHTVLQSLYLATGAFS